MSDFVIRPMQTSDIDAFLRAFSAQGWENRAKCSRAIMMISAVKSERYL